MAEAVLVRAFSPVALVGASLLALTGVITAVRNVKYLAAVVLVITGVLVSIPSPKMP
ncbi:MAG TPA: hypothetical protein VFA43_14030 [Gemmatimonadaceae bacterium]|nr:hypothetical protein [Gemmatimonadaceae bacterium]